MSLVMESKCSMVRVFVGLAAFLLAGAALEAFGFDQLVAKHIYIEGSFSYQARITSGKEIEHEVEGAVRWSDRGAFNIDIEMFDIAVTKIETPEGLRYRIDLLKKESGQLLQSSLMEVQEGGGIDWSVGWKDQDGTSKSLSLKVYPR